MRRVLLSSLQGAAVTQVRVGQGTHEFTTIPGVYEDVVSILLNIKQLRFRLHGDEPQHATLHVKGEKEVKGSDLKLPSQLELANPDQHIATLTDKQAEFSMELQIERGVGYILAEHRRKGKEEIGTILLDAAYSPVRRVSQKVENMRVGERTDFDRLILEIETDGTLDPEVAFYQAAKILTDHFSLIAGPEKQEKQVPLAEQKKSVEKKREKQPSLVKRASPVTKKSKIAKAKKK